jgi:hypothetical protein
MTLKIQAQIALLLTVTMTTYAQKPDSTIAKTMFSGSIMATNNGFSIVPTFSLNSPAAVINLSWRKKKLSFEPDIRLVPDGSKGGLLFWLRYRLVDNKKFSLRVGAHPAFSFIRREVTDNNVSSEITEMLRFVAFEVVPNYKIKPNWSVGAMYLQGHGLQSHGPQNTHVLFLNSSISNIKVGGDFRLHIIPVIYFLDVDGNFGKYFTATEILSNTKWPFSIQSSINKTISSNLPGNKDFMWNVGLTYSF